MAFFFFLGTTVGFLNSVVYLTLRTHLSKVISQEDIAKSQSLFVVVQKISDICITPAYNAIYQATLRTFSKTFLVVGPVTYLPAMIGIL